MAWRPKHKEKPPEHENDTEAQGKNLVGDLADALLSYYADPLNANDRVKITIQTGKYKSYEPLAEWNFGLSPAGAVRTRETPEDSHIAPGSGVTIYPNWNEFDELIGAIEQGKDDTDLRIVTLGFRNAAVPEDKLMELVKRGVRVEILMTDPAAGDEIVRARNRIRSLYDREDPHFGLDALEKQISRLQELKQVVNELKAKHGCTGDLDFRLSDIMPYGFVAHSSAFVILGLFLATGSYGTGPMIVVDATVNKDFANVLKAEWNERWEHSVSLDEARRESSRQDPQDRDKIIKSVISDTSLITNIEAQTPDGGEIWVASPDLSNVGDEMSPFSELVRAVVHENAGRGVNYTYISPQGWAGYSRLENLRECFIGTEGKLYIHQVPPERFLELTLVASHFISFNPLAHERKVYMQLPLSQSCRGWIALDRSHGERVLTKMKQLIDQYPPV